MFLKISKYNCFWVSPGLINSLFGARSDTSRQVDGPPATECHTARGGGWYRWDRHSCWRTDAPPQFCSKYFPCAKYFKWVSFISTSRCMSPSHLCLNQMSSVIFISWVSFPHFSLISQNLKISMFLDLLPWSHM